MHEIYRGWRRIADGYPGDRALIGEVWLPDGERFTNYLRPDELHTAFNFDFLGCAWDAAALRGCIDETLRAHAPVGAPATWVLSNHDVTRHVTRYGRADTIVQLRRPARRHRRSTWSSAPAAPGRPRCSASRCPASAYVYQGEELGLWEVEDIPYELRQDPMWHRSGHADPGRDGCRVPLPWSGDEPPFGFSPAGAAARPWLPQPAEWKDRTVQAQTGDPHSMLELYRTALRIRRAEPALGDGAMTLAARHRTACSRFARGPSFACVVNLSGSAGPAAGPRRLPADQRAARRRPAPAGHRRLAAHDLTQDLTPTDREESS